LIAENKRAYEASARIFQCYDENEIMTGLGDN
jgi:hypothetical protein